MPPDGSAAITSAREISRSDWCLPAAQARSAGMAHDRWSRIVTGERGSRRGARLLPRCITSNQMRSSLIIGAGRPVICLANQAATGGSRSSCSSVTAVRMSRTGWAANPIRARAVTSLAFTGAPGISCRPSRIRIACRASTVRDLVQPCRAAWSRAARSSTAARPGSRGAGNPRSRPAARSRGMSNSASWR